MILQSLFRELLNSIVNNYLADFKGLIGDILNASFFIEEADGLGAALGADNISMVLNSLYGVLISLLALKVIWKGYKVYILWRDGESETSPAEIVIGAIYAFAVAVIFPVLYEYGVKTVIWIARQICRYFGYGGTHVDIPGVLVNTFVSNAESGAALILLSLIFVILTCILAFSLLGRGAVLLIYRLGIPLAVVGLVDSDGGVFKSYIQLLFRQMATNLVQYFCLVLGLYLVANLSIVSIMLGITFLITGFTMPKLLAQLLAPSSGGGGKTQTLYMLSMVAKGFMG